MILLYSIRNLMAQRKIVKYWNWEISLLFNERADFKVLAL